MNHDAPVLKTLSKSSAKMFSEWESERYTFPPGMQAAINEEAADMFYAVLNLSCASLFGTEIGIGLTDGTHEEEYILDLRILLEAIPEEQLFVIERLRDLCDEFLNEPG